MITVNKWIGLGYIGGDPDIRYTQNGKCVANFSVATNKGIKQADGSYQNVPEWHKIVVWEKQAELIAERARKGMPVYIEGRIEYQQWEKDGIKRETTKIIASLINVLAKKEDIVNHQPAQPAPQIQSTIPDDDIPF